MGTQRTIPGLCLDMLQCKFEISLCECSNGMSSISVKVMTFCTYFRWKQVPFPQAGMFTYMGFDGVKVLLAVP